MGNPQKDMGNHRILWDDVSYSFVSQLWLQMAQGQSFEQHGYRFEPIFRYADWELDYGATPMMLWHVSPQQVAG